MESGLPQKRMNDILHDNNLVEGAIDQLSIMVMVLVAHTSQLLV